MYEKQLLKELEALRTDVANAAKKVLPMAGPPKPKIIPPLEDYYDHPRSAPVAQPTNGFHHAPPHLSTPPPTSFSAGAPAHSNFKPPLSADPLSAPQIPSTNSHPTLQPAAPAQRQPSPQAPADPLNTSSPPPNPAVTPQPLVPDSTSTTTTPAPPQSQPLPPSVNQTPTQSPVPPAQSPSAGPPTLRSPLHEPPLGGRFADGAKSMFIKPTAPSHLQDPQSASMSASTPSLPGGSQPFDPLRSDAVPRSATASPLYHGAPARPHAGFQHHSAGLDPLAQVRPHQMSQSMRVQPTRPRLDAREAASKLANMF